jgi:transcriptional regulator with XRE-family HTH domain
VRQRLDGYNEGMTLDALLREHGIKRPADLAKVLDIGRQYAWQLWHGQRKFTTAQALRLLDEKGVPIEQLLRAQVEPGPVPKGRPRKEEQEPPGEEQP